MSRSADVYTSLPIGAGQVGCEEVRAGRAFFAVSRRGVATTFRYEPAYLAHKRAFPLDPALPLFEGVHAIADGLPYCFTDCAPDRWGRNLIRKRPQAADADAGRSRRDVAEIDYLLGVTDLTRQGALRFTDTDSGTEGPFLADDPDVPKLLELPRLLHAAEQVELDDDDLSAVKELLDAGTGSLGGARPKASVRDGDRILIAKFASPKDDWDVIAWEKTALDLAENAGLRVPRRRLQRVNGKAVLLLDRFDRADDGSRIPYMSAMSLLEARDGESSEYDYVDIAEALAEHGDVTIAEDLRELWRRVAFSVAIHNTDDHLRNHGFLRRKAGWTLSPVFDVNPNPDTAKEREIGIGSAYARDEELDGLKASAAAFGLKDERATEVLDEVFAATASWRQVAAGNGIAEREMNRMADAFDGLRAAVG
ncbi:type II toxin-antitoxin system HipA family toxin [Nocardioides albus]|uniref:Serine/threonine-protein kinase HipA n=1 Tax=Nocardioides albus TaxID=1841 RepID=A0A7W5A5F0_9ACTN|nr:type II toxin-antitoxin system HipA family toxin [Nocardioides albus]MBB3089886.1 serine/threonine-protein kinase HipA [Nocardioides albus]GGU36343.1 phosphatidylinositol kinase [Nocardioides albus]